MSEGIEIRQECHFISSLVRALATLPGGIGRFLPGGSWFSYVQVKASWLESVFSRSEVKTVGILSLSMPQGCLWWGWGERGGLGYPNGAVAELLDGTLKLRQCTTILPHVSHMVLVKDGMLLLVICLMIEVTLFKGSG